MSSKFAFNIALTPAHPKMKTLSSYSTHSHAIPDLYHLVSSGGTIPLGSYDKLHQFEHVVHQISYKLRAFTQRPGSSYIGRKVIWSEISHSLGKSDAPAGTNGEVFKHA